jgi:hypothetical protein
VGVIIVVVDVVFVGVDDVVIALPVHCVVDPGVRGDHTILCVVVGDWVGWVELMPKAHCVVVGDGVIS